MRARSRVSRRAEDDEYERKARALDLAHNDPGVLERLRGYGRVRGLVFGAFREWSPDVHALLNATAAAAATRYWREAGAADALAAKSVYLAYYRRRWSCEVALAGARLRVARMTCVTGEAPEPAVVGAGDFDPADHAAFAEIAEFVFGGPPRGQ